MGCWGAGIMESDTALDAECAYYEIAGIDTEAGPNAGTSARQRLEAVIVQLQRCAASPVGVCELPEALKLFDALLCYPTAMSETFKMRLAEAARLIRVDLALEQDSRVAEVLPSYDRASAYQVLATVLMRHGCAFPESLRQEMLDQLLNCDEHAMALDGEAGRFFTHEPSHKTRYLERKAALAELWQQLTAYDIQGGTPCELKSRGLFEAMSAAHLESIHVH